MPNPVTTYILTFKSSVPDEQDRRANLNRFLKEALRKYELRLVKMRTETTAKRAAHNSGIFSAASAIGSKEVTNVPRSEKIAATKESGLATERTETSP